MLVFFFPFFENLGSYVYDSMRARTVLFLKGISAAIFSLRSCTACARVLSLCMRLPAAARGRPRRLGCSRSTRRERRKVDKCRVADKKQTNKHTLLFYRYRFTITASLSLLYFTLKRRNENLFVKFLNSNVATVE